MRLVATCIVGALPHAKYCVNSLREYASNVGADYAEMKWFPRLHTEYNGNIYWVVVDFLRRFSEQEYYTEILITDCDVLILPGCPNLFDLPGDLICAQDQPWPVKDQRYLAWVSRNFPNSSELSGSEGLPYFNSGVLLFRLDALRRMDLSGPYPDDYPPDQDYLNMRVGECGLDVNWVGNEFNQRNLSDPVGAIRNNHILHFINQKNKMERYHAFAFQ